MEGFKKKGGGLMSEYRNDPWMPVRRDIEDIPEIDSLLKQMGVNGFMMFFRLLGVLDRKYQHMPQHPISIRIEVIHKKLFKKIIAMDKLRLLLKIMKWKYFETENEIIFYENVDTKLFKSYMSPRKKSSPKSEDKKNNGKVTHEENQHVETPPKSQKSIQKINLHPLQKLSESGLLDLDSVKNISSHCNSTELLDNFVTKETIATFQNKKLPKVQPSEIITSSELNNFENSIHESKTSINKNITSGGAFKDSTIFAETPPQKMSFENLAIKENFPTTQIVVKTADREFAKMALQYFLAKSDNALVYKGVDVNKWAQSMEALVRHGYEYREIKDAIVYALQSPHWRKHIHEPKDLLAKTNTYTLGRMHYVLTDMRNKTGKTEVTSESLVKAWEDDEIQKAEWKAEKQAERENGLNYSYDNDEYNTYEVN
jgi:hypothetical protein